MELIIIIAIISYIVKAIKKANENEQRQNQMNKNPWEGTYQAPKQVTRVESARTQVQQQNEQWQKAAQENIAKAKQRAMEKAQQRAGELYEQMNLSQYAQKQTRTINDNEHFKQAEMHRNQENQKAKQQVHAARMEARNTTIVQRAKANADADKVDVTLETMEAEHNHSERVSAAIHHHPEDVIPESMLGSIEDLMVKGYDGNLCFERDFVGEAMDMISRFTVPSE